MCVKIGSLLSSSMHSLSDFETASEMLQAKQTKQGMRVYLAMNYCPLNNKFLHYITNIFWLWRWPETELIFGNSTWEALLFVIWPKSHYLFKMQGRMVKKKLYFYPAGRLSSSQNSGRSCPCSIFCQCDFTKTRVSVNQEWLQWSKFH